MLKKPIEGAIAGALNGAIELGAGAEAGTGMGPGAGGPDTGHMQGHCTAATSHLSQAALPANDKTLYSYLWSSIPLIVIC